MSRKTAKKLGGEPMKCPVCGRETLDWIKHPNHTRTCPDTACWPRSEDTGRETLEELMAECGVGKDETPRTWHDIIAARRASATKGEGSE
jgi:hypothetical protein